MKQKNIPPKYMTMAMIVILISFFLTPVAAQEWSWCDCYKTEPITELDFVQNDEIIPIYKECKEGYFVTGFLQTPEENPVENGQFVIITQSTCCKPCINKETKPQK